LVPVDLVLLFGRKDPLLMDLLRRAVVVRVEFRIRVFQDLRLEDRLLQSGSEEALQILRTKETI
jgi:hypothetical protein